MAVEERIDRIHSVEEAIWEIVRVTTWDRCTVRRGEVRIAWQRYHPAYDNEPEIDSEVIAPEHFLWGHRRELVILVFGEEVYREMLAETRARNPGVTPAAPPREEATTPQETAEVEDSARSWNATATVGLLCLLALATWIMYWPARRCVRWHQAHFREQLLTAEGTITKRSTQKFESYAKNTRIYGYEGFVTVRYEVGGQVREAMAPAGRLSGSEKDFAESYPTGATRTTYLFASDLDSPRLFEGDLRPGVIWLVIDLCLLGFGGVMLFICAGCVVWRRG